MKKRILSLLLALVMLVGLLPTVSLAAGGDPTKQVHVTVENTTFTEASKASNWLAPAWSGKEIDTWITLTDDLTMMDCVRMAIEEHGFTQAGAETGYISDINGVSEKQNGGKSGWMGTLNDWFTNSGFANYKASDGTLRAGDEIRVMYTSTGLGADLGADWSNSDKRVKSIDVTGGTLAPAFTSDNHEYTLTLPAGTKTANVTVVPTAVNKQYQVHTFVGETEYRRTESIPVTPGTVITVKSGDPSWETANPNTAPAEVYTIKVVTPGAMLNKDSLSITTIKEDTTGTGANIKLTYNEDTATFSGALETHTQLKQYNDAGFTVKLTLPEGASAKLTKQDGSKIADFVDGSATLANGVSLSGDYTFYIVVTAGDVEEIYTLTLTKAPAGVFKNVTFTLDPVCDKMIGGYPAGTILQLDENDQPTGKTGYSMTCFNYLIYIDKDTKKVNNSAVARVMNEQGVSTIFWNGKQVFKHSTFHLIAALGLKRNPEDVSLGGGTLEISFTQKNKPNVSVTTKFKFAYFTLTPEEFIEKVAAFPDDVMDLTYTAHYDGVKTCVETFENYTDAQKEQIPKEVWEKVQRSEERLEILKTRHQKGIDDLTELVSSYAEAVTADNYKTYLDDVRKTEEMYLSLSDAQRTELINSGVYQKYQNAYLAVTLAAIKNGDSLGYPTQYPDDFMLHSNYYNLDLGQEVETGFREIWTNRPKSHYNCSEKGLPFTSPGLLEFEIKDESIFEIREVMDYYTDKGLSGKGDHENMRDYLVPKKAGTTTFTVKMRDEAGTMYCQTPEIVVHVNSPEETMIGNLSEKLTDFKAKEYTTKYDNWSYEYGTEGAEFSFHVNGENGKVYVYNYLEYNADGTPVKTSYTADGNGDVTILLKDGYNCIEVNADYEGQNVTQVYSLKGKVVKFVNENVSRPGEPLRIGDTAGVWTIGKHISLHKISRIYNNGMGSIRYITDMPRSSLLITDETIMLKYPGFSGSAEASSYQRLSVPLTASGTIVLYDGYMRNAGYGSDLYKEFTQGNTGEIARSTGMEFGHLANITLKVEDNPNYTMPEGMTTVASNGGVVKAGESITISVPDLPVDELRSKYDFNEENKLHRATLTFYTQIPGVKKISTRYLSNGAFTDDEGTSVSTLEEIKNITFTVPASTPAGTYKIHGGYVDLLVTVGFMDSYPTEYRGLIDDVTITVLPGAQKEVMDLIDAIGTVTTSSGTAITAARNAYDALTDEQKALVSNYQALLDAEARYRALTAPVVPVTPSKPSQKPDTGSTLPFTDVFANSWFYDGVKYACEKGFMNGTGSTTFSPDADTTRGMIVTMLARLEGVNTAGTLWYAAGRKWAMDTGISDGTNMTGAVTREQLAAILYRYAKQKGYDVTKSAALTSFTDADTASSYAVEAMQWAVASGLIQGSGSRLSPKATASRAQVATILMRFMELYAK